MMCSDTTRDSDTLCSYPNCTRSVWQDPDGSYSSFCSRTHMESAAKLLQQTSICKHCHEKPVYVENGRSHDFCGHQPVTTTWFVVFPDAIDLSSQIEKGTLPSTVLKHIGVIDGVSEACLACGIWPKNLVNDKITDFCSRACAKKITNNAPLILEVPPSHRAYLEVQHQFSTQWKHPGVVPTVHKIWKIYCSQDHNDRFSRYRLAIERKTGLLGANTRRRFHGTTRACGLGDTDRDSKLCSNPMCSLCSILQSSFDLAKAGQRTNFGRFGAGIYTSATSSKANDYIWERGGSTYRNMILNEVVMGNIVKLTQDNEDLKEPPDGFDAVVGEPGGSLNYDESIVYKNEAIRPVYLIIFKD